MAALFFEAPSPDALLTRWSR